MISFLLMYFTDFHFNFVSGLPLQHPESRYDGLGRLGQENQSRKQTNYVTIQRSYSEKDKCWQVNYVKCCKICLDFRAAFVACCRKSSNSSIREEIVGETERLEVSCFVWAWIYLSLCQVLALPQWLNWSQWSCSRVCLCVPQSRAVVLFVVQLWPFFCFLFAFPNSSLEMTTPFWSLVLA